ncbi:hypothetical protein Patl1_25182 [Pistacia atlantica]|uniref:Uncharacterized protein n=1 Tax=Pistacia atlantica TaxID=434234 RepID=A0ACC1B3U1_9ROSI|nr:hypothetical protein Patl1_25182 [Pistacia atlantica]
MVAEPWILKMGNQVSSNLKHALLLEPSSKKKKSPKSHEAKHFIGILSFEVANVMSKTIHLHKSLTDSEISKLKAEILNSEGIKYLVSTDQNHLLQLALAEKLDDLNRVASVVSRLGKKCCEPALQGFEHVYNDVMTGVIDVKELGFLVKDMESMVRKMERFVNATANLYGELEVLNELEQTSKKFQQNQHEESRRAFEQKLIWQKQDVRHLKEISLWNQTCDKVVELLARTVCTIYARICVVFGETALKRDILGLSEEHSVVVKDECRQVSGHVQVVSGPLKRGLSRRSSNGYHSGLIEKGGLEKREISLKSRMDSKRGEVAFCRVDDFNVPCGASPGRLFMECLSLSSSVSKFDDDGIDCEERSSQISGCCSVDNGSLKREPIHSGSFVRSQISVPFSVDQRQSMCGVTNGAHFGPQKQIDRICFSLYFGEEARDDLYQMLPASLRMSLKTNLKSYIKNLAIYDAPLAHDWKETLDGILKWLAPLAHNMIRWQSERNFEQQQIVTRTNVLLLHTLYFADREKTEAAICELLVGLNYICRYEQQQNALLDCASSFDFEDCMEWQLQYGASYLN